MKFLCISSSNVKRQGKNSASTRICNLIKDKLLARQVDAEVDVLALQDYELNPCIMCGACADGDRCVHDESFNLVYEKMSAADAVFVVCPHYAPIPSKLIMVLEKLEELFYVRYCKQQTKSFPLIKKPVGIVAHGGAVGDYDGYYREHLLAPLAQTFASIHMDVVGIDEEHKGVVFGVRGYTQEEGSMFPGMDHDWEEISRRLLPLVERMLERVEACKAAN